MKKIIASLLAAFALVAGAHAAGGPGIALDKFPRERMSDLAALQNGAKLFVNYCLNCHSAAFMRYNRLRDIGLTDKQIAENLTFATDKIGDTMKASIDPKQAKAWFGANPPDLTLVARSRASGAGSGADYLYTYLRTYYRDETKPTGWNNLVFPNIGMPHPLWELQGERKPVFEKHESHGQQVELFKSWEPGKAGTNNDYRVTSTLRRLQQNVQAFVITHHADKQKKLIPKLLAPAIHPFAVGLWITGLVQTVRNHPGLVLELLQHVAGVQVVRRSRDNPVGAGKEAVHQRSVEFEQVLLANDVRVIGHHAWFVHRTGEMHQVHERPREVVIDHIGLGRHFAKLFEHAPGKPGGGELDVEFGPVHFVLTQFHHGRRRIRAERQHLAVDAVLGAAFAQLEDHLLNAADRVRQVRLEKMKNSHSTSHGLAVGTGRGLCTTLPGKKP